MKILFFSIMSFLIVATAYGEECFEGIFIYENQYADEIIDLKPDHKFSLTVERNGQKVSLYGVWEKINTSTPWIFLKITYENGDILYVKAQCEGSALRWAPGPHRSFSRKKGDIYRRITKY